MARRPNPLPQLTPDRIRHAIHRLNGMRWSPPVPLILEAAEKQTPAGAPPPEQDETWTPVETGFTFGPTTDHWACQWFRTELPDRREEDPEGARYLIWRCNGETTLHLAHGPHAGLDCAHPECRLPDNGGPVLLETCMWQTAIWADPVPVTSTGYRFESAHIAYRNEPAHRLWVDFRVLLQWMESWIPGTSSANEWEGGRHHLKQSFQSVDPRLRIGLEAVDRAIDALDRGDLQTCSECVEALYAQVKGSGECGRAALIGHSHLDLVWRWTEAATRRKAVHTCANILGLLDHYPEFKAMLSQPWLLHRLEKDATGLTDRLRTHIDSGRLELEGVLEVESDVLLSSGETLVRSLTTGQTSFMKWTGHPAHIVWLPDVFGYCGCLPQLIRLAGADGFFTSKLSWSRITPFPYTSFVWEGNDGTPVTAHLPPVTFNGNADIDMLRGAVEDHRQLALHPAVLCPTGYGDGGGGPTEDQVERVRRLQNLSGVPNTEWTSVRTFFQELEQVADHLPRFRGELYLERHRGTLTSQSDHKRLFREAEKSLQTYEAAHALLRRPVDSGHWERVLFSSFHDAIPGSSIREVYQELNPQLHQLAHQLKQETFALLGPTPHTGWFNPLPVDCERVMESEAGLERVTFPALGRGDVIQTPSSEEVSWEDRLLRNGRVTAAFSSGGELTHLQIDEQSIPMPSAPGLWIHPDHPPQHDAWEVELCDLANGKKAVLGPLQILTEHPLRVELVQEVTVEDTHLARLIWSLEAGSDGLDIRVEVTDWKTPHRWLRFVVPTLYQGKFARFGGPFGAALRSQWPGNEQDSAMWEGAGSRWAAVTDDSAFAGLAIISEAKYGFGADRGALSISLLRAPVNPDPDCDIGSHVLRFQLRPWRTVSCPGAPTPALAAEMRYACFSACGDLPAPPLSWNTLGSLVPSWAKPAEENPDDLILRCHETSGISGEAILELEEGCKGLEPVDLLERPLPGTGRLIPDEENRVRLAYNAYSIASFRVLRGSSIG